MRCPAGLAAVTRRWAGRWCRFLPLAALAAVLLLDAVQFGRPWPVPVTGLLDEPAHLLTAAVALLALLTLGGPIGLRTAAWALVGSVVLDLDHVALYVDWDLLGTPGGRPGTHSLATVLVLLAVSLVPRLRAAGRGLALGVVLHLARDLGTGPGVPLLWPVTSASVVIPYPAYLSVFCVCVLIATAGARAVSDRLSET